MEYMPITLNLKNKKCVLIGAGEIAQRKLKHLIKAAGVVTIISPEISLEVQQLAKKYHCSMIQQKIEPRHLKGVDLVICATNNREVNKRVSQLCHKAHIWVNVVDDLKNSSFIMPAIVDRSPLLIAISTGGVSPVLARIFREKLEWILPKNLAQLLIKLQQLRPLMKISFNKIKQRRAFSEWYIERAFEGKTTIKETPEQSLKTYLTSDQPTKGTVYLIGAGPGELELLTIKALKLLQKADVVLHDSLISDEIILSIRKDAKLIDVGKRALSMSTLQQDINNKMVFYARQGLSVVRLKGGDPFIFGRGGEELEHLRQQDIDYEVVPGITAATGSACYAGIPLTHRNHAQSLLFITAHCKNSEDSLNWKSLATEKQTLVVYMGLIRNKFLVDQLIQYGRSPITPIAVIENGTTSKQRVITGSLEELTLLIEQHQVVSPALVIIGEVTKYASKLGWYENSQLIEGQTEQTKNYYQHIYPENKLKHAV